MRCSWSLCTSAAHESTNVFIFATTNVGCSLLVPENEQIYAAALNSGDRGAVERGQVQSCGPPGELSSLSALPVAATSSASSLMANTKKGGGGYLTGQIFPLFFATICCFCDVELNGEGAVTLGD